MAITAITADGAYLSRLANRDGVGFEDEGATGATSGCIATISTIGRGWTIVSITTIAGYRTVDDNRSRYYRDYNAASAAIRN
jgi:hypothetical protein